MLTAVPYPPSPKSCWGWGKEERLPITTEACDEGKRLNSYTLFHRQTSGSKNQASIPLSIQSPSKAQRNYKLQLHVTIWFKFLPLKDTKR